MARVGLPECLIEQEVGIGNDALEPAKASEGIAALCRQLEPLLPLASLLVVQGRALFRLGLVVILAEQEVEGRLHLLALTLAKIEEGGSLAVAWCSIMTMGLSRNRQSSATRLKR